MPGPAELTITVLLIEDNPSDAVLIRELFFDTQDTRFHLEEVNRLSRGLACLSKGDIDVVLLDLSLPESTGLETLSQVIERVPKVPIVVLSGADDEATAIEAVQRGAQDYLVKGHVDGLLLLRSLKYSIERKRAEEALRLAYDQLETRVTQRTAELGKANRRLRTEITERKRTEEQLRHTTDHLSIILDSLPVVSYTTRGEANFEVTYISNNVARMTGFLSKDFTNSATFWSQQLHPEDVSRVLEGLSQLFVDGSHEHEYRWRVVDGTYRWFYDFSRLVRKPDGSVSHIAGMWQDITERKHTEKLIHQSEHLAAVGTLAAGIAHEINNPVAAAWSSAEAALNIQATKGDREVGEILSECLQNVVDSVRRCSEIVDNVLKFARQEPTKKQCHNLHEVILRTVEVMDSDIVNHRATVEVDTETSSSNVMMNAMEIGQVFINLIRNAIQSNKDPVHISIRSECVGAMVCVAVQDDGCGIDEQDRRKAFDPFYTTRHDQGGVGLGLSITHRIVESHGGTIEINGAVGQGTLVTVRLPLARVESTVLPKTDERNHNRNGFSEEKIG